MLKWEVSSTGKNAILYPRKRILGPVLGGVIRSKIEDVAWVQAAFDGKWVGFEPYVRLWIKEGKDAIGLTVLMRDFPKNTEPGSSPDTCVRWAEWLEKPAIQGFMSSDDKLRYVRDEIPVPCVLRFYHSEDIGIDLLMEHTSVLLAGGIAFTKYVRPELERREVAIEFSDGTLFYQLSFSPGSASNVSLERLIQEWLDVTRSLQSIPDQPPDDGFQIAYRESIWEQQARYGESY